MREELDYRREAKHVALYRDMLAGRGLRSACRRSWPELSTGRLLTLDWLEGSRLLDHKDDDARRPQPPRHGDVHRLVASVQPLRRDPRRSASRQLHGVRREKGKPAGINLLDYGCIRIFPPSFVGGVVDLYNGLRNGDDARVVHAYETWGFQQAVARTDRHPQHLGALHLRPADGRPRAHHRRRREARRIRPPPGLRGAKALREKGPVTVPREFVLMDRAAIGLGGVFLHLRAELNFHRLFEEAMEDFSVKRVAERQAAALKRAAAHQDNIPPPQLRVQPWFLHHQRRLRHSACWTSGPYPANGQASCP